MVETVEIKQPETTSEKPVEENVTQSKPEGLPEKFNSVEDLAKSYQELEKKLGDNTEAPKTDAPKNDLDIAEKAVESAGLNMENLSSSRSVSWSLRSSHPWAKAKTRCRTRSSWEWVTR